MKVIRTALTAVLSMALAMVGLTAFAPPASAQVPVPSVSTTCEGLTVDLVNYQIDPGTPAVPNHVTVWVNGPEVANTDFGTAYHGTFPFVAGQSNMYKVVVTAWDGPNNPQTFVGTEAACVVPSTSITVTFPEPTAPTCDEPGALPSTPVQDHVTFTWSEDHLTLTAHAAEGYVLKGDTSKTYSEPGAALGYQNTEDGQCHVPPMLEPATTVVTDAKWGCGDTVTGTTSVTTTYTFEFDSVNGSYGPPIAHVGEPVIGSRDLSTEEILLYQNTDSKGLCYVKPMIKDATAKWECNDKTAVTSSVTTAYSFAFDSKTGTYGPAIAKAGTPVVGTRNLTATEFVACPVLAVEPVPSSSAAPVVTQDVLASTGANDVTPWGVGAGLLALLTGAGLLIARKKACRWSLRDVGRQRSRRAVCATHDQPSSTTNAILGSRDDSAKPN